MEIDERALEVLELLKKENKEIYLVGGSIRDHFLGKKAKDFDFATNADLETIGKVFKEHKVIGKSFEVSKITNKGLTMELARFRNEFEHEGRHCKVDFEADIFDDLKRRDLTINALAFDGAKIIDLFDGKKHLTEQKIQFVGEPEERIKEDNLRLLRAVRIGLKCFEKPVFEEKTKTAILNNLKLLKTLSQERITNEFFGILENIKQIDENYDLYFEILGEILGKDFKKIYNFDQNTPYHHLTLDRHTIEVVINCKSLKTKTAALLHDLGKVRTATINEKTGFFNFINHEQKSVELAGNILHNLKVPKNFKEEVLELIKEHSLNLSEIQKFNERKRKKWVNKKVFLLKKIDFLELLELAEADAKSKKENNLTEDFLELLKKDYEEIKNGDFIKNVNDLKIDKTKLLTLLGKEKQKKMKDLLDVLCLWAIKTGRHDEKEILTRAKDWVKKNEDKTT